MVATPPCRPGTGSTDSAPSEETTFRTWKDVVLGLTLPSNVSPAHPAIQISLPRPVSSFPLQLASPKLPVPPLPSILPAMTSIILLRTPPLLPVMLPEPPAMPTNIQVRVSALPVIGSTDQDCIVASVSIPEYESSEDGSDGETVKIKVTYTNREKFASVEEAKRGIDSFDGYLYTFAYNYGKRDAKMDGRSVYRCISHEKCEKRVRLAPSRERDVQTVWLQDFGVHTGAYTEAKKGGIAGFFLREVDDILLGCGPKKCRKILLDRYADVPNRRESIPNASQLNNRKSTLMKRRSGGWEIKTIAELLEWTSAHLCTTTGEFFLRGLSSASNESLNDRDSTVFDSLDKNLKHGTLVLECFSHEVTLDDGKRADCCGLILTSRAIFWNVLKAHSDQSADGVLGATDGTYILHFGGWTLVDFGTYTTHYEKKQYAKTFVPWAYMFVRTEHNVAYATMFRTVRSYASQFFGIDLFLAFGSLDRSEYIASAFIEVWPCIRLLNCYPHMARNAVQQIKFVFFPNIPSTMITSQSISST